MTKSKQIQADHAEKTVDGIEVYTSPIYAAIDSYISSHGNIDLVKDITQYQWKSVLYWIHDRVFPNRQLLKRKDGINNAYDYDLLADIYNIYKRICVEYNKITFLADYSILTGIDEGLITSWASDYRGLNPGGSAIHQKIFKDSETAVSAQMISSGRNPVGYMAILNHYHGWATSAAAQGVEVKRRSQAEIAADHGLEIDATAAAVPLPSGFEK